MFSQVADHLFTTKQISKEASNQKNIDISRKNIKQIMNYFHRKIDFVDEMYNIKAYGVLRDFCL